MTALNTYQRPRDPATGQFAVAGGFFGAAVRAKLSEGHIRVLAPWAVQPTPEEAEAAPASAAPEDAAATESAAIDAAVTQARAEYAAATAQGFQGGVQSAAPPAGEDFGESIRRAIGL